ncbi:helix-turn-helix transcriptional regulator [Paenibacillus sp. IB182496]|uniref:Helix-turn-helix transcriptional regulator n=1 Tax=Paenibacillus sabuli TaxID=2772509 RepID=A0A927GSE6_9BACL|nr:AraC family transcriptional regulator [Paenibacillus sabuli]MBD2846483.1 helix-turn-helix transcriptional regulator [Paenibacillus sabuli]
MRGVELFDALAEQLSVRIRSCNDHEHGGDWIESKQHSDYDLWIVERGEVRIRTGSREQRAFPGDAVLFYPELAYRATTGTDGCRFVYSHFDLGLGEQQQMLQQYPLAGIVPGRLIREETALFLGTFGGYKRREPLSEMKLRGAFLLLLAGIIGRFGDGSYEGAFELSPAHPGRSAGVAQLQPVFEHIHANLHRAQRTAELAGVAGMSEKYFITYFRQALGTTPMQYVYHLKMHRARDLIYQRRWSVKEIAAKLGYPDPYSFSKAFKKFYNKPPSRFL